MHRSVFHYSSFPDCFLDRLLNGFPRNVLTSHKIRPWVKGQISRREDPKPAPFRTGIGVFPGKGMGKAPLQLTFHTLNDSLRMIFVPLLIAW
jgi:hypothetical protein